MVFIRTLGLLLLLVSILIVPAHSGMASDNSSMMMEMADGSPCPPQDCGSMPNCTMALRGGFGSLAYLMPESLSLHRFDVTLLIPDISDMTSVALFNGDGLRRPPKI